MVEIPRHRDQHERAAALPLVTDEATVTVHEAMDRSRNRDVLDAIRDRLALVDAGGALAAVKDGSTYAWDALDDRLDEAGADEGLRAAVRTLAERFDRAYPSLLRLTVDPDVNLDFSAGQYVTLRAKGTPRPYSIASPPSERELEFAIRRVPGGRLTEDLFVDVDVGDRVGVRGPNGHMVLDDPSTRDVVFLATGTGVAPFKSMIDALFERGWDVRGGQRRHVWMFLGAAWADDLPYREAFRDLDREQENFHFVPTLTREPLLSDWDGETDYVQHVFVKHLVDDAIATDALPPKLAQYHERAPDSGVDARIDPSDLDLYACGITAMVDTLVRCARSVGVPSSRMQYEGFG